MIPAMKHTKEAFLALVLLVTSGAAFAQPDQDDNLNMDVIEVLRMGHKGWPAHDFPLCVDTPVWGELVKQVRAALQMGPAGPPAGAA